MPHQVYKLKNGTKVPSVTTIISRFKESGALMYWAWTQGRDGKDFRETKQEAADAGTIAHNAMEAWKNKQEFNWAAYPPSDLVEKAKMSFSAFLEWATQTKLVITQAEVPLVSEKYKFGGCLDAILVNNKRAIGDYKTSNGLYPDYLLQIAAYGLLWNENFPLEPITGGYYLLRFDKTYGDFSQKWWGELDAARKQFLFLRQAYEYDAELKQRVK